MSHQIVQSLQSGGYKVQSGTAAGSEGIPRDIITAYRPFTIMITGQPNDFAVHIGIGKLTQNLALAAAEAVLLSRLFLAVDVPEMLSTRHVKGEIAKKITTIVGWTRRLCYHFLPVFYFTRDGCFLDTSLLQAAQGEHPSRMDHWLAAVLAVALAVFYILAQSWEQQLRAASTDILVIAIGAVCSLLGLLLVRKWGIQGKFGVAHLGLFLAVFLWFLGMTVWGIYEVVLNAAVPYPSIADVFYLAGYLPAVIGMLQFLWFFRKELTPGKLAVAAFSGLAIVFASSVLLLYPLMTESADILTKFFDVVYPSLDTLLIVLALMMAMILAKTRFANDWLWIALGLLLWGIGDIAFCYGILIGWYYSGHPIGLFWLYGFLALGLGFAHQRRSLTRLIGGSSPPVLSNLVFRCIDETLAEVLGVTIRDAMYFKEGRRAEELCSHIKSLSAILEENLGPGLTRIILLNVATRLCSELHVAFVEKPKFDLVDYVEEARIAVAMRNADV